jgi:hypothetical protein
MPYQVTTGQQYDKQHAITQVAPTAVQAARFIGYDGAHASSAGGLHDVQGVSENPAPAGFALSVITGYSALVEAAEAIAPGDFVTVGDDGTGRAVKGSASDRCGRALGEAQAGQWVEVQLLEHVHG